MDLIYPDPPFNSDRYTGRIITMLTFQEIVLREAPAEDVRHFMTVTDLLTVLAIFLGPIAAIQVQKFIERAKERRQQQLWIFSRLLATRAAKLTNEHVQALNLIELVFSKEKLVGGMSRSKSDNEVVAAWKRYRGHLNTAFDDASFHVWNARVEELFVDLLFAMSKALNYSFDKEDLQRGVYTPQGHGQRDWEDHLIRQAMVTVARDGTPIPIRIVTAAPPPAAPQKN